jgi:hypothetical protein
MSPAKKPPATRWAYLWTPEELIQLDLRPLLEAEDRARAALEKRNRDSAAPFLKRVQRRIGAASVIAQTIEWVREIPPHDHQAAEQLELRLYKEAASAGHQFPGFIYRSLAESVHYRLRPHRIVSSGQDRPVEQRIRRRAAELRAAGQLVLCTDYL